MYNRTLTLEFGKPCTKDDLDDLLNDLQDHLDRTASEHRPNYGVTMKSLHACIDAAGNDHEAELVRAGYRLGLRIVLYEKKAVWRSIQNRNQRAGTKRKAEKIAIRDRKLIEEYQHLLPIIGCLGARKDLAMTYGLSSNQIRRVLKKYGIEIKGKV